MTASRPESHQPDSDRSSALSDYQRAVLNGRGRASEISPRSYAANYGDVVWRWEFPVLSATGQVMTSVRVNAPTEESAIALASLRIDADRLLGRGIQVRPAAEV